MRRNDAVQTSTVAQTSPVFIDPVFIDSVSIDSGLFHSKTFVSPKIRRAAGQGPLPLKTAVLGVFALFSLVAALAARPAETEGSLVPDLDELAERRESSMAIVVNRFSNDRRALYRRYDAAGSPQRRQRLMDFYRSWRQALDSQQFDQLDREGKVDWILLNSVIDAELPELEREARLFSEMAELLPFSETIFELHDHRRKREELTPNSTADQLAKLSEELAKTKEALERGVKKTKEEEAAKKKTEEDKGKDTGRKSNSKNSAKDSGEPEESNHEKKEPILQPDRVTTHRASAWVGRIREVAKSWYEYRAGYDPLFTWWTKEPYETLSKDLEDYQKFLRTEVLGIKEPKPGTKAKEDPPIIGDPIGREALMTHLRRAFIAYTPEELIAIAEKDLAWGVSEMKRAARDLGFGDGEDWKQALEKVKTLHVDPGDQPRLVRDLAYEATEFLEESDTLTIPPLAEEVWRIEMMSPERQKMNPFFLGGEVIQVAFPTDTMTNEQKQMSMRGNNVHFARATVHHELIPGHHLQGFMTSRYNSHRRAFNTPFWGEGWALYWELRLWEMDFPKSPENRIGMLFWRMHRDARVIWSLKFHLGEMTAQDCVDFLVERIGHEKENALAEVRRSLEGNYSPIYQLAYLMGGFQFRALQREVVGAGQMTDREFHDTILMGGPMPIEIVRARITGAELPKEFESAWRYMDE